MPQADMFEAARQQCVDNGLETAWEFFRVGRLRLQPAIARLKIAVVEHDGANRRTGSQEGVDLRDHPIRRKVAPKVGCVPGVPTEPGQGFGQDLMLAQVLRRAKRDHRVLDHRRHGGMQVRSETDGHLRHRAIHHGGAQ